MIAESERLECAIHTDAQHIALRRSKARRQRAQAKFGFSISARSQRIRAQAARYLCSYRSHAQATGLGGSRNERVRFEPPR